VLFPGLPREQDTSTLRYLGPRGFASGGLRLTSRDLPGTGARLVHSLQRNAEGIVKLHGSEISGARADRGRILTFLAGNSMGRDHSAAPCAGVSAPAGVIALAPRGR